MSSPPPPAPPSNFGYTAGRAPAYNRAQMRAQQRAAAAQARAFRMQARTVQRDARLQRRAFHRSIVGPVLVIVLGVLFLLAQTGRLDWTHLLAWYSRWWPAILIGTGALLLVEWSLDQRKRTQALAGPRVLGPGVGALLILLAVAGYSLSLFDTEARRNAYGFFDKFGVHRLLSQEYEWDDTAQAMPAAGLPVTIHNPHGNVTVTGSSQDGAVHLTMHKRAYAWQESSADALRRQIEPHFTHTEGGLLLEVPAVASAEADLTLELPAKTAVVLRTDRGDSSVSGVQGDVSLFSRRGDNTFTDISGTVTAHVNGDESTVSGHKINGSVRVQGRTGDLNFSDVAGPLTLEGDFFGSTHLENVSGTVIFQTSRTHFEAAHLPGSLDLDGGPEFRVDNVAGPVILTTKNRNISLDEVSGSVQVTNRNGTVNLSLETPSSAVQIANERGSVDVALPAKASLRLEAQARNGEIENDFGLSSQQTGDTQSVKGVLGAGAGELRVTTTDGGITLRKDTGAAPSARTKPPTVPAPPLLPSPRSRIRGGAPSLERM